MTIWVLQRIDEKGQLVDEYVGIRYAYQHGPCFVQTPNVEEAFMCARKQDAEQLKRLVDEEADEDLAVRVMEYEWNEAGQK